MDRWDDAAEDVARVRREISDLVASRGEAGPAEGVGEAAEGMIRVVAVDGRLSQVELDPKVMRLPSQTLAEEFTRAANTALDQLRDSLASSAPPTADLRALASQLEQVQEMGERELSSVNDAISRAIAQYSR